MSGFTSAELRALDPGDLADLLRMAAAPDSDYQPWTAAESLGLDPADPSDREAVQAAWAAAGYIPDPYSPPIGAGQPGVRSDLTPYEPDQAAAVDRQGEASLIDVGTIQADPQGARDLALMMDASVTTGEPFLAGTFAMYATPTGEIVMVTEGIGDGVRRSVFPRHWVRTALSLMAGEGGKAKLLGKLFRLRG